MFQHNSCSACCGLFNLPFSEHERRLWLKKNTEEFLALDISQSETIVAFRQGKEKELLPQRIRQDIYVCPFVGIVSGKKIGCLLHPKGSPHPQIQLWPHPQNFSFYGESICLSYDCLVKERMLYRADFFLWAKKADPLFYSRLACDHTLHRALAKIAPPQDLTHFYSLLAWLYARYRVVTTSFEDIAGHVPESAAALSAFLADRIASSPYAGANKFPLFEKLLLRQLAPNSIPRHQQIRKILRQAF